MKKLQKVWVAGALETSRARRDRGQSGCAGAAVIWIAVGTDNAETVTRTASNAFGVW